MVASRLSDQPEWNVLLLEAGPDEPPGTNVPSMVGMFLGKYYPCVKIGFVLPRDKILDSEQVPSSIGNTIP